MPIDDKAIVSQTQAHEMVENMNSKSPIRDFSPLKRADMIGKDHENILKTCQELQMLSRSLSDCKSLFLNVMIQVSFRFVFVSNSQLCH